MKENNKNSNESYAMEIKMDEQTDIIKHSEKYMYWMHIYYYFV